MDQYKLYKGVNFNTTDTILFKTLAEQTNYLNSKLFKTVEGREKVITDSIKVTDVNYYDLQQVTYVSTEKIVNGKTKVFYYFVTDLDYRNDNLTVLNLVLDNIQTYMFDYEIENATIIRQHERRWDFNDKRIFSKTKEDIEVNEYDYKTYNLTTPYQQDQMIYAAIITTKDADTEGINSYHTYGTIPKGFRTYMTFFTPDRKGVGFFRPTNPDDFYFFVDVFGLNDLARNPLIYDIYITPYVPQVKYGGLNSSGFPYITGFNGHTYGPDFTLVNEIKIGEETIKMPHTNHVIQFNNVDISEDRYLLNSQGTQRLKDLMYSTDLKTDSKIFGAQYSSIELVSALDERYEFFIDEFTNNISFDYTLSNDMSKGVYSTPNNYRIPFKKAVTGSNNSIAMINDSYLEYMNNNRHSIQNKNSSNIVKAVVGIGLGAAATVATGGLAAPAALAIGAGIVNQGVGHATNLSAQNAQLRDLKNQPDKISSPGDVDFNMTNDLMLTKIIIKTPSIREQSKLGKYFKLYGYASDYIGRPDITSRKTFNYIELNNMVITGNIGLETSNSLKAIYSQGIRFWHSPETFLNFDILNEEV